MPMIAAVLRFLRANAVTAVSLLAAAVSFFFVADPGAWWQAIDLRTLNLLFCLMFVVAGFRGCALFRVLAQSLLAGRKSFRALAHTLVQLDGDWGIHFRDSLRAPAPATLTSQLFDLTTSSNDTIRYYSGTIDYETTFELPQKPAGRLYLNLNHVGVMAKVKVNGQYAGGVWTAPYQVEVTDLAVAGKNRVEVEVVTTWQNRLIGDSRLPEQERTTWAARNTWTPQDALQPSGLMGPVTLEEVK